MVAFRELGIRDDYSVTKGELVRNAATDEVARVIGWNVHGIQVNFDCICCYETWSVEDTIKFGDEESLPIRPSYGFHRGD